MKNQTRQADYVYVINYAAQSLKAEIADQQPITSNKEYRNLSEVPLVVNSTNASLHGIAHEIRTPLTNISLALGQLAAENLDADLHSYLDIISRSANRINSLVTSLLKLEPTVMIPCGIDDIIAEVLAFSGDRARLRKASIVTDFNDDCQVWVDKTKFKIALANLIINAIEAVPEEKGRIRIKTEKIGGRCFITISDNGEGIRKSDLGKIFSRSFTTKATGSGVGLFVTRSILEDHHANIEVDSRRGKGTKFVISMNVITHSDF